MKIAYINIHPCHVYKRILYAIYTFHYTLLFFIVAKEVFLAVIVET